MASQVSSVSSRRLFWGRDLCYVSGSLSMGSRFTVEQLILCLLRWGFTVLSCLLLYPFLFSPSSVQESPLPLSSSSHLFPADAVAPGIGTKQGVTDGELCLDWTGMQTVTK